MTLYSLNVAVNDYCNNKCQMCNIWRNPRAEQLSLDEYSAALDRSSDGLKHVKDLSLTGGEPLMRKDLAPLAKLFISHLPSLEMLFINTNGTYARKIRDLVDEIAPLVKKLFICVSIEGDPEWHKKIRGIDSFELCIESLREAASAGRSNVSTIISTTIVEGKGAVGQLEFIKALAHRYNSAYTFRLASVSSTYYRNDSNSESRVTGDELVSLRKFVQQEAGEDPYRHALLEHLNIGSSRIMIDDDGRLMCRAGELFCFVQADGNIRPCIFSSRIIGNIKEIGFVSSVIKDLGSREPCPCCTECTIYPMVNSQRHEKVYRIAS